MAMLSLVAAPFPALASEAARPFSAPRDPASFDRALQCLTEAIYYEARSESDEGQRAVAQVVLNRVRHPSYPDSVCGVVYQGSYRTTGCQFSFTCDGSMYRGYVNAGAWERAQRIATAALRGNVYRPVGLALNYHTTAINPYWAPSLNPQTVIGAHIFYNRPGNESVQAFNQTYSGDEANYLQSYVAPQRAERRSAARAPYSYGGVRVEMPTVERPVLERPVSYRTLGARRASAPAPAAGASQSQAQAQPVPVRRGTRTTIEGGVRISRGS
ncbi:MAG TPA: cell wall hydrolase [Allosphingosinicella sp.]|nr:cell wall hydrolase [Allosphingosinicella sp.]